MYLKDKTTDEKWNIIVYCYMYIIQNTLLVDANI